MSHELTCGQKAQVYAALPFLAAKAGIEKGVGKIGGAIEKTGKAKAPMITGLALLGLAAIATGVILGVPQVNQFVGKGITWLNGHGFHGVTGMYVLYGAAGLAGAGYITWLAIRCVQQHKAKQTPMGPMGTPPSNTHRPWAQTDKS